MSKWADSKYEGEQLDGWFHGKGKYYFPTGVIYEGDFYQGEFHGDGILIYPNGGQYKAKWERGKMLAGTYYFEDSLKYEPTEWKYCTGTDRRFHQEIKQTIKPAGVTQMTKDDIPYQIPEGTYDVGEGYYEPVKSIIYRYDDSILRTPSEQEVDNILKQCRYNPKKNIVISGDADKLKNKQHESRPDCYSISNIHTITKEVFKYIAKPAQQKTKKDMQDISQLLKKTPFESQQFAQYCHNSKVARVGDKPKYVYVVTKGEFAIVKYSRNSSKNPFTYLSKIFSSDQMTLIPKVQKIAQTNEVIGLDEIYNELYTYEILCHSAIGELFCIRKALFDKLEKKPINKKPNLQIVIEENVNKPQIIEIHSAKGSTPLNRLHISQIPRLPEEISTHRHEKKTIDFNSYRAAPIKQKYQQHPKVIQEEIEEPPLNDKFLQ